MDTSARRQMIMRLIRRRGHTTMGELADEVGVSKRTIRRDSEVLSLSEPIYTQTGRYGGGVFISNDYISVNVYITENEAKIIEKMLHCAEKSIVCQLTAKELVTIREVIDYKM